MITPPSFAPDAAPKPGPRAGTRPSVIGIGASTGGIDAISEVLANLPTAVMPPIILVQHSRGDQAERLAKVLRQA
ncbi:MAG: chemotaxis protein CheB, partial [Sulfitobacter sp.]|nr:chemotaxis protein CheB [Sulfitobacter sp.]